MNPMLWPTAAVAVLLFLLGNRLARKSSSSPALLWGTAVVLALPGLVFALYYFKLLGEPLWLYRFRALPGTELTGAGMGLLAGMLQGARTRWPRMQKATSQFGLPVIFGFALCLPYLKPVLRPLRLPASPNGWTQGVCRQSTPSTCGPASAATLARLAGVELDEHTLARECFTSERGTENWYLARALRRHGLTAEFAKLSPTGDALPYPAIAGVTQGYGTGHFIPILGRAGANYIVGDPMRGREIRSLADLHEAYQFTGFFLIVK